VVQDQRAESDRDCEHHEPMPTATPKSAGRPRSRPTCPPVAVSSVLDGPGVPATTIAKPTNASICSMLTRAARTLSPT